MISLDDAPIAVIADDFTGAMDTGAQFARLGLQTTFILNIKMIFHSRVSVFTTNSREANSLKARQQVSKVFRTSATTHPRIFKKIDSTGRGNVVAETLTILELAGLNKALICPAIPRLGRTIRNGAILIDGLPVESREQHTHLWQTNSSYLEPASTAFIGLEVVRQGSETLFKHVSQSGASLFIIDAIDEEDLRIISQAVMMGSFLPCGSLGLARAWIQQIIGDPSLAVSMRGTSAKAPLLIVSGSFHPTARAQLDYVSSQFHVQKMELSETISERGNKQVLRRIQSNIENGDSVIVIPDYGNRHQHAAWKFFTKNLAESVILLCQHSDLGGLILIGGETANVMCGSLRADAVEILGELETGVPFGRVIGGYANGLPLLTKAGSFGNIQSLGKAYDFFSGRDTQKGFRL